MDIQLGRSKTVRRAYGIDEIALVPGGRTVDPEVTDTRWTLGGIEREIPIIASAMTAWWTWAWPFACPNWAPSAC